MPASPARHPDVAGAFANCWVDAMELADAEARARGWLEEAGWLVVHLEDCRLVADDEGLRDLEARYVREAREHGGSMSVHTWPPDGEGSNA